MSCDEEEHILAALADHEAQAAREIAKLAASNLDEKAAFTACVLSAKEQLTAVRAANRELENLAEEQNTDEGSQRLAVEVQRHHAQNLNLQAAFVQANAQARNNTETAAAGRRRQLLAASTAGIAPKRASDTDVVASSREITHSLQRTRQLMAQEMEHTSATLAAMDNSNERLAETRDELDSQRGLFSRSRKLLRALLTSAMLDSVSLYGGLALFLVVVAYIVQKRTLYFAPLYKMAAPVLRMVPGITGKVKPALQSLQPAGQALGRVVRPAAVAAWDASVALSAAAAASATNPDTWAALRRQLSRMNSYVANAVSIARKRATRVSAGDKSTTTLRSELLQRNPMKKGSIATDGESQRQNSVPDPRANVATDDLGRLEAERQSLVHHAAAAQQAKLESSQLGQQSVLPGHSSAHDRAPPKQEVDQSPEISLSNRKAEPASLTAAIREQSLIVNSVASYDAPSAAPQHSNDGPSANRRPPSTADVPVPEVGQTPIMAQFTAQRLLPNATNGNVTQSELVQAASDDKAEANTTTQHVSSPHGSLTPQVGGNDIKSSTASLDTTSLESTQPQAAGKTSRSSSSATSSTVAANISQTTQPLEASSDFSLGHDNDSTIEGSAPPPATIRGNKSGTVSKTTADALISNIPTSVGLSQANVSTDASEKGSRIPDTLDDIPDDAPLTAASGPKVSPSDGTVLGPEVSNVTIPTSVDGPKPASALSSAPAPAQQFDSQHASVADVPGAAVPIAAVQVTQAAVGAPATAAASPTPSPDAAMAPSASIETAGTAKQPLQKVVAKDPAQDTDAAVPIAPVQEGTSLPAVAPLVAVTASQEPNAANADSMQAKDSTTPQTTGQLPFPLPIVQQSDAQDPTATGVPRAANSPAAAAAPSEAIQQPHSTPVVQISPEQAQTVAAAAAGSLPENMVAGAPSIASVPQRPSGDASISTDAAALGADNAADMPLAKNSAATPENEAPAALQSADVAVKAADHAQGPLGSATVEADDSTVTERSSLESARPAISQQPEGSVSSDAAGSHGGQQVTPQHVTPQQATSQQVTPQQVTPQQATPQQSTLQQVTPQQATPQQQVTPQQAKPQQVTPQQATPQQVTPQQGNGLGMNPDTVAQQASAQQQILAASSEGAGTATEAIAEEQQAISAAVAAYVARQGVEGGAVDAETPHRYQWRQAPNVGWQLFAVDGNELLYTAYRQQPEQAQAQDAPAVDSAAPQQQLISEPVRDEL